MKRIFLTLLFFFTVFLSSIAQPVFSIDSLIGPDKLLTFKQSIVEGSLGSMGANQDWDFSILNEESGMLYRLSDLSQFPMLNAPQGANKLLIKLYETGESPNDQMNFFKADANGLEQLTIRADGQNYSAFSSPYQGLKFPVEFNPDQTVSSTSVTFTDPIEFGGSDSIRIHRDIELYYSVPGYGQITLPGNKVYQVLVIQRLETVTDSIEIYLQGEWTSFPKESYFNEYYDFLSLSLGYYVMMAKLVDGFEGAAYELLYLHEDDVVGLHDLVEQKVVVYPNPAQDQIHIEGINSLCSIKLLDMQGKVIQSLEHTSAREFSLPGVKPGMYYLRIEAFEGITHRKIIIQ
jgi:hypothetical protein